MAQQPTISKMETTLTAVEWFFNKVLGSLYISMSKKDIDELLIEAKQMEKKQKIEFADRYADDVMGGCLLRAEQYYNETYKKD